MIFFAQAAGELVSDCGRFTIYPYEGAWYAWFSRGKRDAGRIGVFAEPHAAARACHAMGGVTVSGQRESAVDATYAS